MRDALRSILVVDDEPALREVLDVRLRDAGYEVALAGSGEEARSALDAGDPDLVLSDVVLPDASGLDLLDLLRGPAPGRPVILMTAFGSIDVAVEADEAGRFRLPHQAARLRQVGGAARGGAQDPPSAARDRGDRAHARTGGLGRRADRAQQADAQGAGSPAYGGGERSVGDPDGRERYRQGGRRAGDPSAEPSRSRAAGGGQRSSALPEGLVESELFGHQAGAFTGATTARPGCFEMADGGTLFLDEIAEMPVELQPRFLRVLEDGRVRRLGARNEIAVDVRVLTATNRDPGGRRPCRQAA